MKVFLSWSGQTSHAIAERLHKWLPMVIQKINPYISTEIEKGTRWSSDIARELEECSFGIACVTAENKDAPWLLFEAGALSKSVSEGRLAPVLFGLEQSDIQKSPLTQFQMTKFEKGEFSRLLHSINEATEGSLDDEILNSLFDALWPQLEQDIAKILDSAEVKNSDRQAIDPNKIMGAMEELLTNSRAISQAVTRPDRLLPEDYLQYVFRRVDLYQTRGPAPMQRLDVMLRRSRDDLSRIRETSDDGAKELIDRVVMRLEEMRFHLRRDRDLRHASPARPGTLREKIEGRAEIVEKSDSEPEAGQDAE